MTTELINITFDDSGRQTVLGRELHAGLEVGTPYDKWFPRMVEYGFEEGKDFSTFLSESTGGRPSTDHILSLDMAKHLAMIQRTEKGKRIREYFIECEKQFVESLTAEAKPKMITDQRTYQIGDRTIVVPADTTFNVSISRLGAITIRVTGKMKDEASKRIGRLPKEKSAVLTTFTDPTIEAIRKFLDECCEFGSNYQISTKDLYFAWEAWSQVHAQDVAAPKTVFFRRLKKIASSIQRVQKCKGPRCSANSRFWAYQGIGLKRSGDSLPLLSNDLK